MESVGRLSNDLPVKTVQPNEAGIGFVPQPASKTRFSGSDSGSASPEKRKVSPKPNGESEKIAVKNIDEVGLSIFQTVLQICKSLGECAFTHAPKERVQIPATLLIKSPKVEVSRIVNC